MLHLLLLIQRSETFDHSARTRHYFRPEFVLLLCTTASDLDRISAFSLFGSTFIPISPLHVCKVGLVCQLAPIALEFIESHGRRTIIHTGFYFGSVLACMHCFIWLGIGRGIPCGVIERADPTALYLKEEESQQDFSI